MSNAGFGHSVRARLRDGWVEQPCSDHDEAVRLFDRLRHRFLVPVERLAAGRVVESVRVIVPPTPIDAAPG